MRFGVEMFPTDYSIPVTELARAVEERGFESLWFPEHTHIPSSRETPYPGGGELPQEYSHTLDPFAAFGAAAAVTTNLRLGTGICLVVERDPILLAKEVATVDFISGGRFLFGIGGGWNREEMADHGTDPAHRWRLLRERIEAMKQIWTQDEAAYHGRYVNFDKLWSWPKPVQRPHPPIIVGGDGPNTLQRVVDYGDEWMPIGRPGGAPLNEKIATLNRMAAEKGRGPIPVGIFGVRPDAATVDRFRQLGVARCVFALPSAPADAVLPLLDRFATLITA